MNKTNLPKMTIVAAMVAAWGTSSALAAPLDLGRVIEL